MSFLTPTSTAPDPAVIARRIRACDYLSVAQLFLQSNFLLDHPLTPDDIKPRLLGHWGTCHGINVAYANLHPYLTQQLAPSTTSIQTTNATKAPTKAAAPSSPDRIFILGPGHGFPALQANLFLDGDLQAVDTHATSNLAGLSYLCRNFSWPGGFPSHASPITPHVICEGGELGYALGAAYGYVLGHPECTAFVLLGDGELETATALSSLNLVKLLGDHRANGRVLPILHLNGYKISAPTLYGRKSERELNQLIRGFGYTPITINGDQPAAFQSALHLISGSANQSAATSSATQPAATPNLANSSSPSTPDHPFFILRTEKGATGPAYLHHQKISGNYLAHQIPLPNAKTDPTELAALEAWLQSYHFTELFHPEKGFTL